MKFNSINILQNQTLFQLIMDHNINQMNQEQLQELLDNEDKINDLVLSSTVLQVLQSERDTGMIQ